MKRGRKLGEIQNPRDERGWMIPRQGTIRRQVYDAMAEGQFGRSIYGALGISRNAYHSHRAYIVSWAKVQAMRNASAAA